MDADGLELLIVAAEERLNECATNLQNWQAEALRVEGRLALLRELLAAQTPETDDDEAPRALHPR